ncbi:MAG: hypothetical protein PHV59_11330 [Victivallales bacterium]|nr:hypothetical protein [Victivallales bacterium]
MLIVVVLLVLGYGGYFYLEKYPLTLVNDIFNKVQQKSLDFMNKSHLLLTPDVLKDVPEIDTYIKNLRAKITNRATGAMHSVHFKSHLTKAKEDRYPVAKVTVQLSFSEAYKENQETVEFDFIRYSWWRWTALNCKIIKSANNSAKYRQ